MENEEKDLQENSEVTEETVEKAIDQYSKEVEDNRYETKKALMLTAIGAIIVIGAIAVILSLQKSPKDTLSSAMHKTFTADAFSSRATLINDTFLKGKSDLSAEISLKNVSSASDLNDPDNPLAQVAIASLNDLKITKPTLKADLKTDSEGESSKLDLSIDIADRVPDSPFPYDDILFGEDNKTCFALSMFSKGDKAGIIDDNGKSKYSELPAYLMAGLTNFKNSIAADNNNTISDLTPYVNVLDAALQNAELHNTFSCASYTVDGISYGANKYTVAFPEDKKADIISAVTNAGKDNNAAAFANTLTKFIEGYNSETTAVSVYERNGYIGAAEITTQSNGDENSAGDFKLMIMFVNDETPCGRIKVSYEVGNFSFSAVDHATDGSYNIALENVTFDTGVLLCDITGNIVLSKIADDFLADVDTNVPAEYDYNTELAIEQKYQDLTNALMPTGQELYRQIMMSLYGA